MNLETQTPISMTFEVPIKVSSVGLTTSTQALAFEGHAQSMVEMALARLSEFIQSNNLVGTDPQIEWRLEVRMKTAEVPEVLRGIEDPGEQEGAVDRFTDLLATAVARGQGSMLVDLRLGDAEEAKDPSR